MLQWMKHPGAIGALCALLWLASPTAAASDEEGVRATLNQYLMGHATGDPSHMRKAFLPTAHIEGMRDGKFVSWTLDEYCARFTGRPAADEAGRERTIDHVDITGTAAMARATLVHGATTFTDYFVLLKVDGKWKIANKVYFAAMPEQARHNDSRWLPLIDRNPR